MTIMDSFGVGVSFTEYYAMDLKAVIMLIDYGLGPIR